eukprot:6173503-Pleurochrysis_carterae.AAC.2
MERLSALAATQRALLEKIAALDEQEASEQGQNISSSQFQPVSFFHLHCLMYLTPCFLLGSQHELKRLTMRMAKKTRRAIRATSPKHLMAGPDAARARGGQALAAHARPAVCPYLRCLPRCARPQRLTL